MMILQFKFRYLINSRLKKCEFNNIYYITFFLMKIKDMFGIAVETVEEKIIFLNILIREC